MEVPGLKERDGLCEREINDGLSECDGLGARDDFNGFSGLGVPGGLIAAAFGGRSGMYGLGGLATFVPDAAVFSLATSSRVRLRQSPGGTSSASGPYCTRRIFST